ncbi:MAG TPA: hypothetical protein VNA69_06400 [Thermoanaerobaculia bacterium]|nr:hypothetical protein [Thermoanaerobaculia bacterium]
MEIPIVAIISSFTAAIAIVYLITHGRQRRVELQTEMQTKLIERFGSAPEMVSFLQSPAGRDFVTGVQLAPAAIARDRILGGFTRAIVLTALGTAFLFLTLFSDDDFVVPAAILLSLGIGYLIATFVSYKLSASLTARAEDATSA